MPVPRARAAFVGAATLLLALGGVASAAGIPDADPGLAGSDHGTGRPAGAGVMAWRQWTGLEAAGGETGPWHGSQDATRLGVGPDEVADASRDRTPALWLPPTSTSGEPQSGGSRNGLAVVLLIVGVVATAFALLPRTPGTRR